MILSKKVFSTKILSTRVLSAAVLSAVIFTAVPVKGSEPQYGSGETDGYKLVWQDLFDGTELNELRWNIEVNGDGGGNNELQYYTDNQENVRVGDDGEGNGCLILTARREKYRNKNFTSGRVNSAHLVTFTHGKIEASIKLPKSANGLWPAFWMMGDDYDSVGWPKCGETDILEMGHSDGINNGTSDRYFNGACHWGPQWPQESYAKNTTKAYSLQDGEFHLYTLIWDENRYRMYVDLDKMAKQVPYFELKHPMDDPDNAKSAGNYFHKPNFILFNMAVGGNFPGIHDAGGITALNEENGQQASMYVNYVKIYQKEDADNNQLETLVETDPLDAHESGIEVNLAETNKTATEVFNLGGMRVAYASAGEEIDMKSLQPGFYIVVKGNKREVLGVKY